MTENRRAAGLRRGTSLALVTFLASLVTLWMMRGHPDRILVGDPAVYRERVVEILGHGWPYLEVPFEHLPVMLVPMFLAWFLGGALSQSHYVLVFAGLMGLTLAATTFSMTRLGDRLSHPRAGSRWLLMILPIMPLVIFRNDPVVVLLAVVGLLLLRSGSPGWVVFGAAGALAKVWTASIAWLAWPKQKLSAVVVTSAGLAALGISMAPGFAQRRDAGGIHSETMLGGLVGLGRTVEGEPLDLVITTAAYLEVSDWILVVNAALGLAIFVYGLVAVRRVQVYRTQVVRLGTVVSGVILTSPLFSLQYVLWLLPFLALSTRRLALAAGLGLAGLSTWLGWVWSVEFIHTAAFYSVVTARNLLMVCVALGLSIEQNTGDP